MSKKILITLSDAQAAALDALMRQDLADNRTAFIVSLIGAEVQRRQEQHASGFKRPVGRPRKGVDPSSSSQEAASDEYELEPDYSHDLPKDIPHFGRMIGRRELADIESASRDFKPQAA